ncbi:MAG: pentapeptide repeat-containing protein [Acidobacteria bacterium]|nr:pentapeptide repeat-containing protein [Acidobacteriota bacterium]
MCLDDNGNTDHDAAKKYAGAIRLIIKFLGNPADPEIGLNLSGTYLKGSRWSYLTLPQSVFSDSCLEGVQFEKSTLSYARFDKADLRRAQFKGTDLSYVTFENAHLADADFHGSDLTGANFSGAKGLTDPQVINAQGLEPVPGLGGETRPAAKFDPALSEKIQAKLRQRAAERMERERRRREGQSVDER